MKLFKNVIRGSFFLFLFLGSTLAWGQTVSGKVVNANTREPINGAVFSIKDLDMQTFTAADGTFALMPDTTGRLNFSVVREGYELYLSNVNLADDTDLDLGTILMFPLVSFNEADIAYLSEADINETDETAEVVSLLTASMDEFNRTAAFDFGVARFRIRGYENDHSEVFLNGMPMNDLDDGFVAWSIWGGLNDVMRIRQANHSMEPSFFAFGSLGGSSNISTLASDQRKQVRASFSLTNRTYRQRAMLTYSTGMLPSGWAFSFSGSRRWSEEGYVEGTFYDAYSYFGSVDKKINNQHLLNVTFLTAPSARGRQSGAIQEIYDLLDDNYYNSYWGYQDGKKRNSRESRSFQPVATLRHVWTPGLKTTINTTLGYQGGRYGSTRLDWYNAADPRPNYYQYLPSFRENETEAQQLQNLYVEHPELLQLDWNRLYEINNLSQETIFNANGQDGNHITGALSQYVIEEQRQDPLKLSFHSNIQSDLTEILSFYGGLSYQYERVNYFRVVDDLLGGDFYLDLDKYAERDFPNDLQVIQNDLNQPNRLLYEQDTFGYNYQMFSNRGKAWAKGLVVLDKVDAYLAADISYSRFYRNGLYRNGKFPDSSFGKSETNRFVNFGVKGGLTYKINGRNYMYVNGLYMTRAPFARNVYISPRTRDQVVDNLSSELVYGGELGYEIKAPRLTAKINAYYTDSNDGTSIRSFYHDDEASFVNYILTGIDQVHMGLELSALYKITSALSVKGVAAIGEYFYDSRPVATISQDNNAEVLTDRLIYMKNFRIDGTPQKAYSVALSYNSPNYWFVNLSFNYFDDIYLDFNPERRTLEAVDGLDRENNPELWYSIIDQEKLPSDFVLNFFGGKSWKIDDYYLYLNLGVNNILNNTNFRTGGYEQLRFDFEDRDVNAFPSRYFYAFGLNYFLNISFRI
jgi:hypothetical protein